MTDGAYEEQLQQWRLQRERRVFADNGWYSVIGLEWLEPGSTTCGSDSSCNVALPTHLAPARLVEFQLEAGGVRYQFLENTQGSVAGEAVHAGVMASDRDPQPTLVSAGKLQFELVARGDKRGIRIREIGRRPADARLEWFAADESWRVQGTLERHAHPLEVEIPTVLGLTEKLLSPGVVNFQIRGKSWKLLPVYPDAAQNSLMFIFRDATSGRETYGSGRFLMTEAVSPGNSAITLDFNRAICPPCAFTPHATCPIPPECNALDVAITAGEKSPPAFD